MPGLADQDFAATTRRADVPSTQDILHRDGRPVPFPFALESPKFLGDADVPYARYTDQAFFDREMRQLWPRVWQWACREEHIPEPGDFHTYEVGDHAILIVRGEDMAIRAFVNSCMHRGMRLKRGSGSSPTIRCPFHGWTWTLDGQVARIPCRWDFEHVREEDYRLPEVRVGTWGGFVFINMDADAAPLEQYIAPIAEHLGRFDLANRYIEIHIEKEFYCNWKSGIEAFIENYHTQETHPQLLSANYDEGTQYDVFSDNISRFLSAFGVSSTHLAKPLTEQELANEVLVGDRGALDQVRLAEGETARSALAQALRVSLRDIYGADLADYADTEMIDVAQYSIFPNMVLFPGLSLPFAYRIRPIGMDPNRCLFELLVLREGPADGPRPEPATPFHLREEDSFALAPGFDPLLAQVFDQDTGNLRDLQEGMRSARKAGATLGNYQEVRIRALHNTLDKYLSDQ